MGARLTEGEKLARRLESLAKEAKAMHDKLNNIYNDLACYDPDDFEPFVESCKCCNQQLPHDREAVARSAQELTQVESFMAGMDEQAYYGINVEYLDEAVQIFCTLDAKTQDKLAKLVRS